MQRARAHTHRKQELHTQIWFNKSWEETGRLGCWPTWEKIIINKEAGLWGCEMDWTGAGWCPVTSFCEHGNKPLGTCRLRSAWLLAVLIDGAIVAFSVTLIKFDGGAVTDDVRNGSGVGRKFVWFVDVMKLRTTSRSRCTTMKSRSVRQMASATGMWQTLCCKYVPEW